MSDIPTALLATDPADRVFDWAPRFDPRSKAYPLTAGTVPYSTRRRNKLWRIGPILNQGAEGACVGFGWTAEALATPVAVDFYRVAETAPDDPSQFARFVYGRAQKVDEWEGENYSGTSVLAGVKTMRALGLVREYRWCFSITDVVDAVLGAGPVVLGINWYSGMYEAPGGTLDVTGGLVGGHCLPAVGYKPKGQWFDNEAGIVLQNSWGYSWGADGLAVIRQSDLSELLSLNGEACVATARSYGRG